MRLIKTFLLLTWFFVGLLGYLNADMVSIGRVHFRTPGPTFNAVHYIGPAADTTKITYIAVGEGGWIFRLRNFGRSVADSVQIGSNPIFTGVSFGTGNDTAFGFIVGYYSVPSGWRGVILRTTNRGVSWNQLTYPAFPGNVPTPFLDVYAVSRDTAWVSCGNGYVIRTVDGGDHWRRSKPGGEDHFGWLWGIWAPNSMTAWVCSDQSGLISVTADSGVTWTDYYPFVSDTLQNNFAYRHICGDLTTPGCIYVAGSYGTIVSTQNNGTTWAQDEPFDFDNTVTNCEWVNGIFSHMGYVWCVGTGGTIADNEGNLDQQLLWFSRKYDFQDVNGGATTLYGKITYLAVGSNATIYVITIDTSELSDPMEEEKRQSDRLNFWVEDIPNDNGWSARGGWDTIPGADIYKICLIPPPDYNLNDVENPVWIFTDSGNIDTFSYNSVLNGYDVSTFAVQAYQGGHFLESDTASVITTDDSAPPQVSGLTGWYNDTLGAAVLRWNTITAEPNLGGYWVCPELADGINHATPLLTRNYYIEKLPPCTSAVFQVCAMDRSGNWGHGLLQFISDRAKFLVHLPMLPLSIKAGIW